MLGTVGGGGRVGQQGGSGGRAAAVTPRAVQLGRGQRRSPRAAQLVPGAAAHRAYPSPLSGLNESLPSGSLLLGLRTVEPSGREDLAGSGKASQQDQTELLPLLLGACTQVADGLPPLPQKIRARILKNLQSASCKCGHHLLLVA